MNWWQKYKERRLIAKLRVLQVELDKALAIIEQVITLYPPNSEGRAKAYGYKAIVLGMQLQVMEYYKKRGLPWVVK